MRVQILFFALLFSSITASCQSSSAGVDIPAKQTFLLGEYADYDYKAKLENKGSQTVTIELRSKENGELVSSIQLSPKQSESFEVPAEQIVAMVNSSDRKAKIFAKMSKKVVGMSYVGQDEEIDLETIQAARVPSSNKPVVVDPNAGTAQENAKATVKTGEALVLGEGTSEAYAAEISKIGGSIKVSIRDRRTNEQTQGFGLGSGRSETVNIRPYEVIYLVHDGGLPARVSVTFSKPVSGARVVEVE